MNFKSKRKVKSKIDIYNTRNIVGGYKDTFQIRKIKKKECNKIYFSNGWALSVRPIYDICVTKKLPSDRPNSNSTRDLTFSPPMQTNHAPPSDIPD